MNYAVIKIEILKAMRFTPMQWRNQMRWFFEIWAMKISNEHFVLLEELSRNEPIWSWYQTQFCKTEEEFYKQNRLYINSLGIEAANELFDVFSLLAYEIEEIYPITLINNLRSNGQRVTK